MSAIHSNRYELMQQMGSETTNTDVARMIELLKVRGIITFEQLDELTDKEFFALVTRTIWEGK